MKQTYTVDQLLAASPFELREMMGSMESTGCLGCRGCTYCTDCTDCTYCTYCTDCTYCTGCTGLRDQHYVWCGTQLSREQYLSVLARSRE
jgi:hypothetical protein